MDLVELEELRLELATYFCEDDKTFKLEECIKIFHTFCEKFKKAIQVCDSAIPKQTSEQADGKSGKLWELYNSQVSGVLLFRDLRKCLLLGRKMLKGDCRKRRRSKEESSERSSLVRGNYQRQVVVFGCFVRGMLQQDVMLP